MPPGVDKTFFWSYFVPDRPVGHITMSARIVNREERRDAIAQAAAGIFVHKGFVQTTVQEIATRAGMGKGTIYGYFPSKEAIIHHLFQYMNRMMARQMGLDQPPQGTPPQQLQALLDAFERMLVSPDNAQVRLMFHLWAEALREQEAENIVHQELRAALSQYRLALSALIRSGQESGAWRAEVDPEAVTLLLLSLMDELLLWTALGEDLDYPRAWRSAVNLILQSLIITAPETPKREEA